MLTTRLAPTDQDRLIAYQSLRNPPTRKDDVTDGYCFGGAICAGQAWVTNDDESFDHLLELTAELIYEGNTLTDDELLAVHQFLDNIDIIQYPQRYPEKFPGKSVILQPMLLGLPLIATEKVKDEEGIVMMPPFIGTYTQEDLVSYIASLQDLLTQPQLYLPHIMTLVLRTTHHAVAIGFRQHSSMPWLLFDINHKKTYTFSNINDFVNALAIAISKDGLEKDNIYIFSTSVMTTKKSEPHIKPIVHAWKKHKTFGALHKITKENAVLVDANGVSRLFLAITQNNIREVLKLLKHGANIDEARTCDGVTPLFLATVLGNKKMVSLLLKRGADRNIPRSTDDFTPLMEAAKQGDLDILEVLLENSNPNNVIQVNSQSSIGFTALSVAVREEKLEVVERLMKIRDIEVDKPLNGNETPLFISATFGNVAISESLLSGGASWSIARRSDNATPEMNAAKKGHTAIVNLLQSYQAKHRDQSSSIIGKTSTVGVFSHRPLPVESGSSLLRQPQSIGQLNS